MQSAQYNTNTNTQNRIDLVLQKQPLQVQSKLMQLLVHYNASLQYNSKQDKFQVDLLLPFHNQNQKSSFLSQFYKTRSISNQNQNQKQQQHKNKNKHKNKNNTQNNQTNKQPNQIYKQNRQKIIQSFTNKNKSQTHSQISNNKNQSNNKLSSSVKLNFNQKTNRLQLQLQIPQNNHEKDKTSVSTKILTSINFQKISQSLDQNLQKAIKNIKVQKKKQNSYISNNQNKSENNKKSHNSSILSNNKNNNQNKIQLKEVDINNNIHPFQKKKIKQNQSVIMKIQQQQMQQSSQQAFNPNQQSPIYNIKIKSNQINLYQQDRFKEEQYKLYNHIKNTSKQYQQSNQGQSSSSIQTQGNILKIQNQQFQQTNKNQFQYNQYNSPSKNNKHQNHHNVQILIEDQSGFSEEYSDNPSMGSTIRSNNNNNQNFSSFIINKIIQENMEQQSQTSENQGFEKNIKNTKFQKQIQLFPNSDRKNYQYTSNSYQQRYSEYKKSHRDYLLQKYKLPEEYKHDIQVSQFVSNKKNKQKIKIQYTLGPNLTLKRSYNQFFKNNQKNLQKVYQQIRNDIKKNKNNKYSAYLNNQGVNGQSNNILIQQDDYQDQQQDPNSEQAAFKKQVMQHYTDKIVVTNQTMSSQDLVKYFRYLLRNARSLYLKQMKKGSIKNIIQNKFNKPFK